MRRMTTSQGHDAFDEPTYSDIPRTTRAQVRAMEASPSAGEWNGAGMAHCILGTRGRRSRHEHKVALPYWFDPLGHRVVCASFAGGPRHPAWYLNLRDRRANPEVRVRTQHRAFWAVARPLEGDEYDRTWAALVADRPFYADYQSRTPRKLPLVRLIERRPA
jgi:deazaflavin-dependent oxidoreductase (nitroreductase family)